MDLVSGLHRDGYTVLVRHPQPCGRRPGHQDNRDARRRGRRRIHGCCAVTRHRIIQPTRLRPADVIGEAVAAMLARPMRAALTAAGTLLGVAAFVAVLGLTSTASGQISSAFNALSATEVDVTDAPSDPLLAPFPYPPGAEQRLDSLNGVVAAGIYWQVSVGEPLDVSPRPPYSPRTGDEMGTISPAVTAASPGYLRAAGATVGEGRLFDRWQQAHRERVALLGQGAAYRLGVNRVGLQPVIFIGGMPFSVIGIIDHVDRQPGNLASVLVPASTAQAIWGDPDERAGSVPKILIATRLGAAQLIARQAALAANPEDPHRLHVIAPPDPRQLRNQVNTDLSGLFLALAGVCLIVGAFGIANTTLVAVLERTGEIGLRRALGARPRHIAAHFLTESAFLGFLGGLTGTSAGVASVVAAAVAQHWTPVIAPQTVLPSPFIGAAAGLVAGLYPAWRAARIEPAEALRR